MALQITKNARDKANLQQAVGARHDLLLEQIGKTDAATRQPGFTSLPPTGVTPPTPNPLPDINQ